MKAKNRFVLSVTTLLVIFAAIIPSTVLAASGGPDADHDGLTNAQERACGTNPKVADSNHNGILDGAEDRDHDGLSNRAEAMYGTSCKKADTDHDGLKDGQEVSDGLNPKKADSDGDGLKDGADSHPEDASSH